MEGDLEETIDVPFESLDPTIGLSFSGGGVRSATFHLGVLQGLAGNGVLKKIGYLSSVSGGSYINGWLAHWIWRDGFLRVNDCLANHSRDSASQMKPREASLSNSDWYLQERPVRHLRSFSSYLTPRRGMLSADVWSAAAAYLLRLMPNMLVVLLAAITVITLPYLIKDLYVAVLGAEARMAVSHFQGNLVCYLKANVPLSMNDRDTAFRQIVHDAETLQSIPDPDGFPPIYFAPMKYQLARTQSDIEAFEQYKVDPAPNAPLLHAALNALRNDLTLIQSTPQPPYSAFEWNQTEQHVTDFLSQEANYRSEQLATRQSFQTLKTVLTEFPGWWDKPTTAPDLKESLQAAGNFCANNLNRSANPKSDQALRRALICYLRRTIAKGKATLTADQALSPDLKESLDKIDDSAVKLDSLLSNGPQIEFSVKAYASKMSVLLCIAFAFFLMRWWAGGSRAKISPHDAIENNRSAFRQALAVFFAIVLLSPVVAFLGLTARMGWCFAKLNIGGNCSISGLPSWQSPGYLYHVTALLAMLAFIAILMFSSNTGVNAAVKRPAIKMTFYTLATAVGTLLFAGAAWVFGLFFLIFDRFETGLVFATTFGPLLLFIAYAGMASVGVAVLRFRLTSQEWLNRIWGITGILVLVWTGVTVISLQWPWAIALLRQHSPRPKHWLVGGTAGWVFATITGILSAFSAKSTGPPAQVTGPIPWRTRFKRSGNLNQMANLLARLAPGVFVLGIALGMASLVDLFVAVSPAWWLKPVLTLVSGLIALALAGKLDINRLSLHNFYRFRLIECYIAASSLIPQTPNIETQSEFGVRQSSAVEPMGFQLQQLKPEVPTQEAGTVPAKGHDGPLPLFNCTLNVNRSETLELQQRKARSFSFSPVTCGFHRYLDPSEVQDGRLETFAMLPTDVCASRPDPPYSLISEETERSITLGSAMAISGAAQSPNEGAHTSPAVAALLTLFNIRLGWWLGNPRNRGTQLRDSPGNGLKPLLDELLARATDRDDYIYLSDGGHFENLGIYELVRRRCKVIIAGDAGCDDRYSFEDLINAIELCQTDFGVTITLDTDPLQNSSASNWSRSPFTVGLIRYSDGDPVVTIDDKKAFDFEHYGLLLYLKSAVTRSNSMTVLSYDRKSHPFPHEPTTNQWFDQEQFEAYRLLGVETIEAALNAICIPAGYDEAVVSMPAWWSTRKLGVAWPEVAEALRAKLCCEGFRPERK